MARDAAPLALLALGLLAAACNGGSIVPDDAGDGTGGEDQDVADDGDTATADSSGSDEGPTLPGPALIAVPDAVARGGRIYVIADELPRDLRLTIGDATLGPPLAIIQADFTGALYRVPEELALGDAVLRVHRIADLDSFAEHPLTIADRRFVDVAAQTDLAQSHDATGAPDDCAESHTGLAWGDYDGDGAMDFFVGNVGSGGRLHRNRGDVDGDGLPDFEDITEGAGLSGIDAVAMATFVDLEGDGDPDLFIGRRGENRVFENRTIPDGDAAFVDVTAAIGLGVESQRTMGVAFGDYDGDDDLDLYVVNHAFCFPTPGSDIRAEDHLYRNDDGVFVERTIEITGEATSSIGFSASWVDVDRDGDQDLIIINDAVGQEIGKPNALWRNDGPGPDGGWMFTDVSLQSGIALPGINGMGLALGDVNFDGAVDLSFTNIGENYLMLGVGDGTFVDVSVSAGIGRATLPWGHESTTWATHLLDHDNDGDLDLYFTGGRIKGTQLIPDALFDNRGDTTFDDITWISGMADPNHGKSSAIVDFDGDGAWDIVTTAWGDPLRVYHNRAVPSSHHWLDIALVGRGGNRDAIGAIVELSSGERTQTCFHTNRPSLGAGGDTACHFGLGERDEVDAIRITWPDGTTEAIVDPPAVDQRVQWVQAPR